MKARAWRIASGVFGVAAATVFGTIGCEAWLEGLNADRVDACRADLSAMDDAVPEPDRLRIAGRFAEILAMADEGTLSSVALFVLEHRCRAIAADGLFTARESPYLLQLLDDIPVWVDEVHGAKYRGMR